jgi:hypothetical protein
MEEVRRGEEVSAKHVKVRLDVTTICMHVQQCMINAQLHQQENTTHTHTHHDEYHESLNRSVCDDEWQHGSF